MLRSQHTTAHWTSLHYKRHTEIEPFIICNFPLGSQIQLIANQDSRHAWLGMLLDFVEPIPQASKGVPVGEVENEQYSVCSSALHYSYL